MQKSRIKYCIFKIVFRDKVGETHQYGLQRLDGAEDTNDLMDEEQECFHKCYKRFFNKHSFFGFIYLLAFIIARSSASLSAQISIGTTNMYVINCMRVVFQTIVCFILVIANGHNLLIPRRLIIFVVITAFLELLIAAFLATAASILPVGNMEGMFRMFCILLVTPVDLIKYNIRKSTILLALFAVIGVLLIGQPWNRDSGQEVSSVVPCLYWENNDTGNYSSSIVLQQHLNQSVNEVNETLGGYYITFSNTTYNVNFNPDYLGYLLIFLAAGSMSLYGFAVQRVVFECIPTTMIVWVGIFEGMFLLIGLPFTWLILGSELFSFPTELFCVLLTQCYVIAQATANIVLICVTEYFRISTIYISVVLMMVILYVCQRTFLKTFHPGHANALEIIGILVILFSQLFQVILKIRERKQ